MPPIGGLTAVKAGGPSDLYSAYQTWHLGRSFLNVAWLLVGCGPRARFLPSVPSARESHGMAIVYPHVCVHGLHGRTGPCVSRWARFLVALASCRPRKISSPPEVDRGWFGHFSRWSVRAARWRRAISPRDELSLCEAPYPRASSPLDPRVFRSAVGVLSSLPAWSLRCTSAIDAPRIRRRPCLPTAPRRRRSLVLLHGAVLPSIWLR
jgi:hypothetical protein